jgi:hypothetical protein
MNKRMIFLLTLFFGGPAFADCNALGKQGRNLDLQLETAMQQYKAVVTAASSSSDRPNMYAKAIEANDKLLGAFNSYVTLLERGEYIPIYPLA